MRKAAGEIDDLYHRAERKHNEVAPPRAVGRENPVLQVGHLAFIDVSGAKTNMTRPYGRTPNGRRAHDHAPQGYWRVRTMIASSRTPNAEIEYLPLFSSDLNRIEKMWNKIKAFLQATKEGDGFNII